MPKEQPRILERKDAVSALVEAARKRAPEREALLKAGKCPSCGTELNENGYCGACNVKRL